MTTKNPNKSPKNKLTPIKDISKSLLLINWEKNPTFNLNISPLDTCKNKKYSSSDNSNNDIISYQRNIKTKDYKLNMTINDILDKLEKHRNKNLSPPKDSFSKITDTLDKKGYDNSNNNCNQIITYKPSNNRKSLDDFFTDILNKNKELETKSTLFRYDSERFLTRNRNRRRSIYFPGERPNRFPPLPPPAPKIEKKKVNIEVEIECLDDILKLIEDYPMKIDVEYNINMQSIHNIKEPLIELKNMIGMQKLKNSIVDQILYFIQEFHKVSNSKNDDFMHTVIYGPPGTGKTETAKIIGKIFSKLGILSKKYFKKVTRADLIAGYLGQTAMKTRDVLKEAKGGVLFIDEAYALGNPEKRDSFAKECIDTLCEGLSDNKDDLMVIIAGYEEELKNCFFAYNQGLDSRFTWRFNTDDYKYNELFLIFQKKVKDIGWKLHKKVKDSWFEDKMDYFKFYGRDIETLLAKVKIAHGRRVFCLPKDKKMIITVKDLDKGYNMFLDNNEVKSRKDTNAKDILKHMYV
jgi:SpoVK/Ycf46/Vps4 family AAA+-type ATPase